MFYLITHLTHFTYGYMASDIWSRTIQMRGDIPNSITPQTTLCLLLIPVRLLVLPCTHQCRRSPLTPSTPFFLFRIEEPTKARTCARDRRALQQLTLNVHVKHSDLTGNLMWSLHELLLSISSKGSVIHIIPLIPR